MNPLVVYIVVTFFNIVSGEPSNDTSHANILRSSEVPKGFWDKLPKECGRNRFHNSTKSSRIIDGAPASLGQFPWIVRMGKTNLRGKKVFLCGATLISKYYVVSAAHCDDGFEFVRVGDNYLDKDMDCDITGICAPPYQDIPISRYIFQDFCRVNLLNDLMLIELTEPVQFNDFVQPACLPFAPIVHENMMGRTVSIAGWGATTSRNVLPSELLYVVNTVIETNECKVVSSFPLRRSQLCIGTPGLKKANGTCRGDSGGPVTYDMDVEGELRAHLIGAVSYGNPQCEYGPSVYTDVSYYTEWIFNSMKKH